MAALVEDQNEVGRGKLISRLAAIRAAGP